MFGIVEITVWHYVGFILAVVLFLALDLGVFHRHAHVVQFKEALAWTCVWVTLSLAFAGLLVPTRGTEEATEFLTGYVIELSLSMDNVFVIAVIFSYFRVPAAYQHRVLFWGILGALVMRGAMIGLGAALVHQFHWMLYVFGGFLVLTGIKMFFSQEEGVHPEKNWVIRLVRSVFPVTRDFEGEKFITRLDGRLAVTPLALVLAMVETTDLIFAVDSIPAIFAVTQKPFIIFTSNVFAILGLRSLYFVLAGAIRFFRFLKYGLAIVLMLVGVKMLLLIWEIKVPTIWSLAVVASVILVSILASVMTVRKAEANPPEIPSGPHQ